MLEATKDQANPREGDEIINCRTEGCDIVVIFTSRDKEFFEKNGWTRPARCKKHREEFKRQRKG